MIILPEVSLFIPVKVNFPILLNNPLNKQGIYNSVFNIRVKNAFLLLFPAGNFTTIILYINPKTIITRDKFNKRLAILEFPE
jgi:hypothetical protein